MGEAAQTLEKTYSYKDIMDWPEGERWELIDGVPLAMSPAPDFEHQVLVRNLFRHIDAASVANGCQAVFAPIDVYLVEEGRDAEGATNIVQPHILVICDQKKAHKRGCVGSPDLIVEVVSPSSAVRDNITKVSLYERFGVPEYWIANLTDRLIFQRVLQQTEQGMRYGIPRIYGPEHTVPCEELQGFELDLRLVFEQDPPPPAPPAPPKAAQEGEKAAEE